MLFFLIAIMLLMALITAATLDRFKFLFEYYLSYPPALTPAQRNFISVDNNALKLCKITEIAEKDTNGVAFISEFMQKTPEAKPIYRVLIKNPQKGISLIEIYTDNSGKIIKRNFINSGPYAHIIFMTNKFYTALRENINIACSKLKAPFYQRAK